jgi:hypothetical protein
MPTDFLRSEMFVWVALLAVLAVLFFFEVV